MAKAKLQSNLKEIENTHMPESFSLIELSVASTRVHEEIVNGRSVQTQMARNCLLHIT
jgi:hypothetical protein